MFDLIEQNGELIEKYMEDEGKEMIVEVVEEVVKGDKKEKYKDMMRKFVNNFNKSGDVQETVSQMKVERKDEMLHLSLEEIEDIIKNNI
jgi:hypothetical protein